MSFVLECCTTPNSIILSNRRGESLPIRPRSRRCGDVPKALYGLLAPAGRVVDSLRTELCARCGGMTLCEKRKGCDCARKEEEIHLRHSLFYVLFLV